jgi:hypothetical protein
VLGLVLLSIVTLLTSCRDRPHPYLSELKQLPGASLVYPGSLLDRELGSDSDSLMGGNPADYGIRALTNASPAEILDYFNARLVSLGWMRDDSVADLGGYWATSYGWTRNGRRYLLGFYGDRGRANMIKVNPEYVRYRTIYSTNLQ